MPLTLRGDQAVPLTHQELDDNLTYLEDAAERAIQTTGHEFSLHTNAAVALTPGVKTWLQGDGAGFNSEHHFASGVTAWDGVNQFDLANLNVPIDTQFELRLDVEFDLDQRNTSVTIGLDVGIGSSSEFTLVLRDGEMNRSGVHVRSFSAPWFSGNANLINFPTRAWIQVDKNTDVRLISHYLRFTPVLAQRPALT